MGGILQSVAVPREFASHVSLRSLVAVPKCAPGRPLVLALHGWGMSERSFTRWLRPGIDAHDLSWWVPRGILPGQVKSRKIGYGWYVFDGDQDALRASMDEARAYIVRLVEVARRQLRPSRIALVGFSQGAYLGSYVALSRPDLFSHVVCCCGRPKAEFIDDLAAARCVAVLVQTGAQDESVPPDLISKGVEPMRAAGLRVEERSYDAGHRLTTEMAVDAAAFVA